MTKVANNENIFRNRRIKLDSNQSKRKTCKIIKEVSRKLGAFVFVSKGRIKKLY